MSCPTYDQRGLLANDRELTRELLYVTEEGQFDDVAEEQVSGDTGTVEPSWCYWEILLRQWQMKRGKNPLCLAQLARLKERYVDLLLTQDVQQMLFQKRLFVSSPSLAKLIRINIIFSGSKPAPRSMPLKEPVCLFPSAPSTKTHYIVILLQLTCLPSSWDVYGNVIERLFVMARRKLIHLCSNFQGRKITLLSSPESVHVLSKEHNHSKPSLLIISKSQFEELHVSCPIFLRWPQ